MKQPVAVVSIETIRAAKSGSRSAMEEMFRVHQPGLLRYLRTRSPAMADDIASQTWISVTKSIRRFEGDGEALRGWIYTIGHRRLADEYRRESRQPDPSPDLIDLRDDVSPEDIVTDQVGWAGQLLAKLPPQQADVIMLRVLGGLSVAQVAQTTGLTPANIRVLSHRGLGRLQRLLESEPQLIAPGTFPIEL